MNDTTDVAGRRLTELLSADDTKAAVEDVLRPLLDKLFYVVLGLGGLSIAANLIRAYHHGWHPSYFVDVGTFALIMTLLAFRKRIRATRLVWVIVTVAALNGLMCLAALGLAGAGMLILTASCILAGVLFGLRPGLVMSALCLAAMGGIGILMHRGVLHPLPDTEDFLRAPSTWFTQAMTFAVYAVAVIFAAHAIQQRLSRSRSQLAERTEQLRAAYHRLRASEEKYRLLAENSGDMVFVQDADLRILYCSSSAERLFGYTTAELSTLTLKEAMTPESFERAVARYRHYLPLAKQRPVAIPLMEYEYIRKDNTRFWGELRVAFLYDEDGNIKGSQGVLRDITERKQAEKRRRELEEELRQSEKMRIIGQLAGGVAHDFNNQLAAIMGFAELIRRDEGVSERSAEYVTMILKAAKRSSDLTGKLLAFARKGKYRNEPLDLHEVIVDTVEVLRRSIGSHITIGMQLDAEACTTIGDASQLESAFLNLGLNARDAMGEGGTMVWKSSVVELDEPFCRANRYHPRPGRFVEVVVADDGAGIPPEVLEHIFEPFFTTKEVGSGTGMGLAAVDGTIRNHRGALTVESVAGAGTTFRLYLPLLEDTGQEAAEKATAPSRAALAARIMIVDDEPLVCRMAGLLLERLGYETEQFTDPRDALAFFETGHDRVAMVIVDAIMPGMSGTELHDRLKRIDPAVRVLMSSGHHTAAAIDTAGSRGSCGFIRKPFSMHEMSVKVDEVLTRRS